MSNLEIFVTFVVCLICIGAGVGIGIYAMKVNSAEEEESTDDTTTHLPPPLSPQQGEKELSPQKQRVGEYIDNICDSIKRTPEKWSIDESGGIRYFRHKELPIEIPYTSRSSVVVSSGLRYNYTYIRIYSAEEEKLGKTIIAAVRARKKEAEKQALLELEENKDSI